jgi:hypothetical protein
MFVFVGAICLYLESSLWPIGFFHGILELEILFAPFTDEELRDIDKLAWDPVL